MYKDTPLLELRKSKPEQAMHFAEMERANDTQEFVIPYSVGQHESLIEGEEVIYLSVYHYQTLTGFIILAKESEQVVEFRRIVIADKGQGLGQLAITAMEQYCAQVLNCSKVWLDVFESNQRGWHIYTKLGYRQFKIGEHQGKRLIFMEKIL